MARGHSPEFGLLSAAIRASSTRKSQPFPFLFKKWTAQRPSEWVKIGRVNIYACTLLALDPSAHPGSRGLTPDPWQRDFLVSPRPANSAELQPAERQIDGGERPGAARRPVHARRAGAAAVAVAAAERRDFPQGPRRLRRAESADPGGLREPIAVGIGQRRSRAVSARPRGDHPLVRRRDAAGAGRGGADPGSAVSQRAADAGGVARPAGGAAYAVRPARLVL